MILPECVFKVQDIANAIAIAYEVETLVPEGQGFSQALNQGKGIPLLGFHQHALGGIQPHNLAGIPDEIHGLPRNQSGAGRDIQHPHRLPQPSSRQGLSPIALP
jgi:hypothetical protein